MTGGHARQASYGVLRTEYPIFDLQISQARNFQFSNNPAHRVPSILFAAAGPETLSMPAPPDRSR